MDSFQILLTFTGILIGALLAGFGTFYLFNGRLSRLEGQMELLIDAFSNQYPLIKDVPVPAPEIENPVGGENAIVDTLNLKVAELQSEPAEIQEEIISTVFELI